MNLYGEDAGAGSVGAHIVRDGDTLYGIAQRYKLEMKDIAAENDLYPPYNLAKGQRLKLPVPPTYKVRDGDTIFSIARLFATDIQRLSAVNGLPKPYTIYTGQILKLPRVTVADVMAQQAREEQEAKTLAGEPMPAVKPGQVSKDQLPSNKGRTPVRTNPPKRSGAGRLYTPVKGRVLSSYGPKKDGLRNDGINIGAPMGSPVKAAENGVVVYAGNELKGSGNLILIRHDDRLMTAYGHLQNISIRRGQIVKRGDVIGKVGKTGFVSEPQLHFEVRKGTKALDPKTYLGEL